MTHRFDQQRVLVVGGSSGIGLATAAAFAAAGAQVTIASRSTERLAAAAATITSVAVATAALDTTDDAAVEAFCAHGEAWDHVVVSAAQTRGGPARQLPLEQAYAAMNSKFWGAYRIARAVRLNAGGTLTLVSGQASQRPRGNAVLQGAINSALETLTRGLALELAPNRVNCVSPGTIATPMWDRLDAEARQKLFDDTAQRLPVRRIGQAEEVAMAALYLAGNGYATGSTVLVDGGGVMV